MKKILQILSGCALILGLFVSPVILAPVVSAQSSEEALCKGSGGTWDDDDGSCTSDDERTVMGTIQQITNVLLFIGGAIAVIMIIVGGIRYAMSAGDQNAVGAAKNTILYAVIGLVVVLAAFAVVNFVLTALDA